MCSQLALHCGIYLDFVARPCHTSLTREKGLFKQSSSSLAASWSTLWSRIKMRHSDNHSTPDGVATWRTWNILSIQLRPTWLHMPGAPIPQCSPLTTHHTHQSTSLLRWWVLSEMLSEEKKSLTQSVATKADTLFVFLVEHQSDLLLTVVQSSTDCKHSGHELCLIHGAVFSPLPVIALTTAPARCRPGLHILPHIKDLHSEADCCRLKSRSLTNLPSSLQRAPTVSGPDSNTTQCGPSGPVTLTPHKATSTSPRAPWETAEG